MFAAKFLKDIAPIERVSLVVPPRPRQLYPYHKLEVGESIFIPGRNIGLNVVRCAWGHAKRFGKTFNYCKAYETTVRSRGKIVEGIRLFRIA